MNTKILVPIIIIFVLALFVFNYYTKSETEKNTNTITKSNIEAFLNSSEVKSLLNTYQKHTTLLKPHLSTEPIGFEMSKMGGIPNLNGFDSWPKSDICGSYLNFVIQIYKEDLPKFYFPSNKNLFQIFRCPNDDCSDNFSEKYDHRMFQILC